MKLGTLITATLISIALSTACHHSKSSSDHPTEPPPTTSEGEKDQVIREIPTTEDEQKIAALSETGGCLAKHASMTETLADASFIGLLKTIVSDGSSPEAQEVANAIKANKLVCP